jgi:hypothetical protein
MHPDVSRLCLRAAALVGLDVAGIDLRLGDIGDPLPCTGDPDAVTAGVIEINAGPGLRMTHAPVQGRARDVGDAIVRAMFPSGSDGRIPTVAVTGTNWWAAPKALTAMRPRFHLRRPHVTSGAISAALTAALEGDGGARVFEAGDIAGPFPGASPVTQTYEVGLAPAAALEPLTATVRIVGDSVEVYAGCQAPGLARLAAAELARSRPGPQAGQMATISRFFAACLALCQPAP